MRRAVWLCLLGWSVVLSGGCVQRRLTIYSDPPGAMVAIDGVEIGPTPVDVPSHLFVYYGSRQIVLKKDGYEPLKVIEKIRPPWYERFPIDFFAENVVPLYLKDHHVRAYTLVPTLIVPTENLLQNADAQRDLGRTVGPPPGQNPVPVGPPQ